MRVVLLIAVLAGCARTSASTAPAPPEVPAGEAAPETLWDSGTFITVDKEVVLPGVEESFEIYRTADGYRITVRWKRPAPTGEPSDGEAVLVTDPDFRPLQGSMMSTLHAARDEITRSTIQREPDGRQVIAACENGKLAGEVARGTTIVRKDDLALARVLEKWFR